MGAPALDARDLVERLWREAGARTASEDVQFPDLSSTEPLEHSEEFRYVNVHWELDVPTGLPAGGPRWKRWAKDRVAGVVLHLLRRYFDDEREFLAYVVRLQNRTASSHDELVEDVQELADAVKQMGRRLEERDELLHRLLEERVERLEARVGERA